MKVILIITSFILCCASRLCAQDIVYISQWTSGADRDVIFVGSPGEADLVINVVERNQLQAYKNAWFLTTRRSEATLILRKVTTTNGNRNALRVYLNDPPKRYISGKWVRAYKQIK